MTHRRPRPMVVLGGGTQAVAEVRALRADGYDGPLLLVSPEPRLPYRHEPLADAYLLGLGDRTSLRLADIAWFRANRTDLILGSRAERIDVARSEIHLVGHGPIAHAGISVALDPGVDEPDRPGIHRVDTLARADRLLADLPGAAAAQVLGYDERAHRVRRALGRLGLAVIAPGAARIDRTLVVDVRSTAAGSALLGDA